MEMIEIITYNKSTKASSRTLTRALGRANPEVQSMATVRKGNKSALVVVEVQVGVMSEAWQGRQPIGAFVPQRTER